MVSLLDTLSLTLIGVCWKLLQHRQAGEALQNPLVYVWRYVENARRGWAQPNSAGVPKEPRSA